MGQVFNVIDYGNRFSFTSGWLCLEFVNTVNFATSPPNDRIGEMRDLIAWGCIAGLIDPVRGAKLDAEARSDPISAQAVLAEARLVRMAIYQIILAAVQGDEPGAASLAMFNATMRRTTPHLQIKHTRRRFEFGMAEGDNSGQILGPVVWSAVSLLISRTLPKVKRCQGRNCSHLFVDETRPHNRRWCSMKKCGNRAKGRRHYARSKSGWW